MMKTSVAHYDYGNDPQGPITLPEIPEEHQPTVSAFLGKFFEAHAPQSGPLDPAQLEAIREIVSFVSERFRSARYVLGLALDFALLAQQLSTVDSAAKAARPKFGEEQLFSRYRLVHTRGSRQANTLTLIYQGKQFGIRKLEEEVIRLFISLNRPGYPSAYVYNTGQWKKFAESLLVPCFRLSDLGRHRLCRELIALGVAQLSPGLTVQHSGNRVRVFDRILSDYPRSCDQENAGTALQGIAYGFFHADRPHLSLIVDKSRTGSARQRRIGDIDGYVGLSLELSVEVKDHDLHSGQIDMEFGEYVTRLAQVGASGIAVVSSADIASREALGARRVRVLSIADMQNTTALWDWHKQDVAVQGFLHFVSHVEQNPDAVERLRAFIDAAETTHWPQTAAQPTSLASATANSQERTDPSA